MTRRRAWRAGGELGAPLRRAEDGSDAGSDGRDGDLRRPSSSETDLNGSGEHTFQNGTPAQMIYTTAEAKLVTPPTSDSMDAGNGKVCRNAILVLSNLKPHLMAVFYLKNKFKWYPEIPTFQKISLKLLHSFFKRRTTDGGRREAVSHKHKRISQVWFLRDIWSARDVGYRTHAPPGS